jgi:integrase
MARQIDRLSALQVSRLSVPGVYPDGQGLYLQVGKTGTKSWLLRYSLDKKEHWMGLGSAKTFTLAEARVRAVEQRKLLADGINPLVVRRTKLLTHRLAEASVITFDKAAEQYIEAHSAGWSNTKHAAQWTSTLKKYASPVIGELAVSEVTAPLVLRILKPIWTSRTETASRLRGRIESVLDWAKAHGYRTGENPASWKGHLQQALPAPGRVSKGGHHAALPWMQMGAFMQEVRAMPGGAALATEFIVLTAARTTEAIEARWAEFDMEARVWVVPAERMKARKEHRVPLSQAAIAVLERARTELKGAVFVFPGRGDGALSNMACLALLKRMGRGDVTVHGMRSAFRDWSAERTNYADEVVKMAMAHTIGDKVEAAYRRGDLLEKRVGLMDDWARWCAAPHKSGTVVPIDVAKVA